MHHALVAIFQLQAFHDFRGLSIKNKQSTLLTQAKKKRLCHYCLNNFRRITVRQNWFETPNSVHFVPSLNSVRL